MTPTQIATHAAERLLVVTNITPENRGELIKFNAALILSAAAKMVQQSGAIQALEAADRQLGLFSKVCEAEEYHGQKSAITRTRGKNHAALHSLRSITGEAGK